MRRSSFAVAAVLFVSCVISATAQSARAVRAITPHSNTAGPTDAGQVAHTNIEILSGALNGTPQTVGPPFPGLFYETPASLACIYNLANPSAYSPQCNPNAPLAEFERRLERRCRCGRLSTIRTPLRTCRAFRPSLGFRPLPPAAFRSCMLRRALSLPDPAPGRPHRPGVDPTGDWELEESLDIEYVHGMAPGAKLYLVEAQTNSAD